MFTQLQNNKTQRCLEGKTGEQQSSHQKADSTRWNTRCNMAILGCMVYSETNSQLKLFWIDCPLAVSIRKLIVQLCSLTGTVFPSDAGVSHGKHLLQLISGIIIWIHPLDVIAKEIECGRRDT